MSKKTTTTPNNKSKAKEEAPKLILHMVSLPTPNAGIEGHIKILEEQLAIQAEVIDNLRRTLAPFAKDAKLPIGPKIPSANSRTANNIRNITQKVANQNASLMQINDSIDL